jgi:hypothetical protein
MTYSLKVEWTGERIAAVRAALNLPGVSIPAALRPDAEAGTEAPDPAAVLTVNLELPCDVLDGFEAALLDALPLLAQAMVDAKAGPPSAYAAAQATAAHTYAALQDIRTYRRTTLRKVTT